MKPTAFSILALVVAGAVFAGDALVVGVPYEDIDGILSSGAVNVLYSAAEGLTADGNQFWHQDSAGIPGDSEVGDLFGRELASGDFNGDGAGDLAIAAWHEDINEIDDAGIVLVLYSDSAGVLTAAGNQIWYQGLNGLTGIPERDDHFGRALTTGDFNGDGYDELAVGAPGEDDADGSAGAVYVLTGS